MVYTWQIGSGTELKKKIDYLIIGQGLAGSAIAWELSKRGKSILVFDEPVKNRASAYAAGLFNPITGRVMTKAWQADTVFPFLEKSYSHAEKKLKRKFLHLLPVYRPFVSPEEKQQWKQKSETEELKKFLLTFHGPRSFSHTVRDPFGGIEIAQSGYLNVVSWMSAVRDFLREHDAYKEEAFQEQDLLFDEGVQYKEFRAGKIIFCNGLSALGSRWFSWLPLKPLKGETLDVKIQSVANRIYNRGVYLVPTSEEGRYKVGATYQHPPFLEGPSEAANQELVTKLLELTAMPFEIIHQDWGIRPTTPDRRPMLGPHPSNKNVIIFNGLGTKGVSLAPYFAYHLANWMEGEGDLSGEVNIYRFKALYSVLL